MKRVLCLLLCAATVTAFGQGSTLYRINMVKPKAGMKSAFEASWKMHSDKFHKTTDKRTVYEIISGSNTGSYLLVEGPESYADMDKPNPTAKEHALDLEKNFTPKLDVTGTNSIYRLADTLSYNGAVAANLLLISITTLKDGKAAEYTTELKRAAVIYEKMKLPISLNIWVKQQAGSSPVIVTRRNLKDGYKELETGYIVMGPDDFKKAYIANYGQDDWDKRIKLMVDDVVSREQFFEKLRADLGSK